MRQPQDLRGALGELLNDGEVNGVVRPEIAASWSRSIASDLHPDRFDVPYEAEGADNDRLIGAAQPIVRRLADDLASTSMSLLVADKRGHVVARSVDDGRLRSRLDGIMLAPGFLYRENCIGTNAIGTALEERAPSVVVGTEHFADALTEMACAAVPIFDPATGSVLGAIDLTCSAREAHSLMLALVKHAAHEVEQQLVRANPEADRLLLERFVGARRHTRGPLVGLSGQAMYTNARAAKLLRGPDRSALWEFVSAGLVNRSAAWLELPTFFEGSWSVACEAIVDGGDVVGALLRFQARPTPHDPAAGIDRRTRRPTFGWESLNENELSLAELIVDGLSNREAAARLFVSHHTIDFHLRQIYQKLGIHSRVDLARIAIEHGAIAM
ncbi:MAG: Fis family transcriptional regulator [Actinomycetia bacterium]|jgi:DNA-binding CsgD family transcriptional regulator|nr:Fis family transcriptional regulator [Actinomycetes bacterium]